MNPSLRPSPPSAAPPPSTTRRGRLTRHSEWPATRNGQTNEYASSTSSQSHSPSRLALRPSIVPPLTPPALDDDAEDVINNEPVHPSSASPKARAKGPKGSGSRSPRMHARLRAQAYERWREEQIREDEMRVAESQRFASPHSPKQQHQRIDSSTHLPSTAPDEASSTVDHRPPSPFFDFFHPAIHDPSSPSFISDPQRRREAAQEFVKKATQMAEKNGLGLGAGAGGPTLYGEDEWILGDPNEQDHTQQQQQQPTDRATEMNPYALPADKSLAAQLFFKQFVESQRQREKEQQLSSSSSNRRRSILMPLPSSSPGTSFVGRQFTMHAMAESGEQLSSSSPTATATGVTPSLDFAGAVFTQMASSSRARGKSLGNADMDMEIDGDEADATSRVGMSPLTIFAASTKRRKSEEKKGNVSKPTQVEAKQSDGVNGESSKPQALASPSAAKITTPPSKSETLSPTFSTPTRHTPSSSRPTSAASAVAAGGSNTVSRTLPVSPPASPTTTSPLASTRRRRERPLTIQTSAPAPAPSPAPVSTASPLAAQALSQSSPLTPISPPSASSTASGRRSRRGSLQLQLSPAPAAAAATASASPSRSHPRSPSISSSSRPSPRRHHRGHRGGRRGHDREHTFDKEMREIASFLLAASSTGANASDMAGNGNGTDGGSGSGSGALGARADMDRTPPSPPQPSSPFAETFSVDRSASDTTTSRVGGLVRIAEEPSRLATPQQGSSQQQRVGSSRTRSTSATRNAQQSTDTETQRPNDHALARAARRRLVAYARKQATLELRADAAAQAVIDAARNSGLERLSKPSVKALISGLSDIPRLSKIGAGASGATYKSVAPRGRRARSRTHLAQATLSLASKRRLDHERRAKELFDKICSMNDGTAFGWEMNADEVVRNMQQLNGPRGGLSPSIWGGAHHRSWKNARHGSSGTSTARTATTAGVGHERSSSIASASSSTTSSTSLAVPKPSFLRHGVGGSSHSGHSRSLSFGSRQSQSQSQPQSQSQSQTQSQAPTTHITSSRVTNSGSNLSTSNSTATFITEEGEEYETEDDVEPLTPSNNNNRGNHASHPAVTAATVDESEEDRARRVAASIASGEYSAISPELVNALVKATKRGDATMVRDLVSQVHPEHRLAFVNHRDKNGSSAIFHTVWPGHLFALRTLLQMGADPNLQNLKQNTALHLAVERGHLELIRELLKSGADYSLLNYESKKCWETPASESDRTKMERFILNAAAEIKRGGLASNIKLEDLQPSTRKPDQDPFAPRYYAKHVRAYKDEKWTPRTETLGRIESEEIKQILHVATAGDDVQSGAEQNEQEHKISKPSASQSSRPISAQKPVSSKLSVHPPSPSSTSVAPSSSPVGARGWVPPVAPWFVRFARRALALDHFSKHRRSPLGNLGGLETAGPVLDLDAVLKKEAMRKKRMERRRKRRKMKRQQQQQRQQEQQEQQEPHQDSTDGRSANGGVKHQEQESTGGTANPTEQDPSDDVAGLKMQQTQPTMQTTGHLSFRTRTDQLNSSSRDLDVSHFIHADRSAVVSYDTSPSPSIVSTNPDLLSAAAWRLVHREVAPAHVIPSHFPSGYPFASSSSVETPMNELQRPSLKRALDAERRRKELQRQDLTAKETRLGTGDQSSRNRSISPTRSLRRDRAHSPPRAQISMPQSSTNKKQPTSLSMAMHSMLVTEKLTTHVAKQLAAAHVQARRKEMMEKKFLEADQHQETEQKEPDVQAEESSEAHDTAPARIRPHSSGTGTGSSYLKIDRDVAEEKQQPIMVGNSGGGGGVRGLSSNRILGPGSFNHPRISLAGSATWHAQQFAAVTGSMVSYPATARPSIMSRNIMKDGHAPTKVEGRGGSLSARVASTSTSASRPSMPLPSHNLSVHSTSSSSFSSFAAVAAARAQSSTLVAAPPKRPPRIARRPPSASHSYVQQMSKPSTKPPQSHIPTAAELIQAMMSMGSHTHAGSQSAPSQRQERRHNQ